MAKITAKKSRIAPPAVSQTCAKKDINMRGEH
jgi:hypothetical protein